ncbi:helix-turn-helix domain-containing protein [Sphingomonas sp. A2-49]|nr:helix-turn-helix domain-containing protein [Sphingomonas sp. A2-49]
MRAAIIGLADNGRCEVPLTQEEVGDALGLTAVHVNRVLRRLPESGSVELAHQELLIKDAKRLTHEARFDRAYLEPWLSKNDVSTLVDSLTVPPKPCRFCDFKMIKK